MRHPSEDSLSAVINNANEPSDITDGRLIRRRVNMKQIYRFYLATLVAGLFCLGLMFSASVSAADESPCAEDIAKFCKNIKPGTNAMMDCLEEHESKLSDACKEHEAKMGGSRVEMREAVREEKKFRQTCNDDIAKFCKDVNAGQGGLARCIKEHVNELSAPCRESVKAMQDERIK
jgi:hypothetical protein